MHVPTDVIKQQVNAEVDLLRARLIELSHAIHANPEIGFQEFKTAQMLTSELDKCSKFVVETGIGGLPTAFRASLHCAGPGPTIGILAEYDALPGVGHACGHNIIGTSAIGAGLALAAVADRLTGTAEIIGTPAEEGGGGKIILLERGVFDRVDAALIMHPSGQTYVCPPMIGMRSVPMEFRGAPAHGGSTPHEGRSALAAVIQTFNAVDALRHHVRMDARMHGIITHGGDKPSVIPEYASCHFYVRAADDAYLDELVERVKNCARGAALMTDTDINFPEPEFPAYAPYLPNQTIATYYARNVESLGEPAKRMGQIYASNDIGNVSRRLPVVEMMIRMSSDPELVGHSRESAQAAISPLGDACLILGAKSQAMTAVDLLVDPVAIERAKEELRQAS